VRERLLAVHILAGVDGVDGLRRVVSIGGGNTDDVNVRICQQFFVGAIHLHAATLLRRRLQTRPVDVTDSDGFREALLLELVDNVEVRLGAPPTPMNPTPIRSFALLA